jgi:hypothetical protein
MACYEDEDLLGTVWFSSPFTGLTNPRRIALRSDMVDFVESAVLCRGLGGCCKQNGPDPD